MSGLKLRPTMKKRTRQDGASGTWVSEDVERTDSLRSIASLRMTGGTFTYEEWGGRDATRNQDCRSDRDQHLCWRTASEGGPYKVYEPWKSA